MRIMECTIRDGGYAIDFQWPPDEIEQIVRGLADAGFDYIEVGHGLGLGASRTFTPARCSDEEMAALAVAARGSAKIGAFFIPGVGTADDLRRFRDAGADFVRVGTDVSKSQSPLEFLQRAIPIVEHGATTVTVVDSAGGMLPNQVAAYVEVLKAGLEAEIGFHGH